MYNQSLQLVYRTFWDPYEKCWFGQKVCLGFSIRCTKSQMTFLTSSVYTLYIELSSGLQKHPHLGIHFIIPLVGSAFTCVFPNWDSPLWDHLFHCGAVIPSAYVYSKMFLLEATTWLSGSCPLGSDYYMISLLIHSKYLHRNKCVTCVCRLFWSGNFAWKCLTSAFFFMNVLRGQCCRPLRGTWSRPLWIKSPVYQVQHWYLP